MNLFFWKYNCPSKNISSALLLADKLRERREFLKLSLSDVVLQVRLPKEVLSALEEGSSRDDFKNTELLQYGYRRLAVLRYLKFLRIPFDEISSLLPPPPSLNPEGSSLLKNNPCTPMTSLCGIHLSRLLFFSPKRHMSRFVLEGVQSSSLQFICLKKRPHYLHPVLESVLKFTLIVVTATALFYLWSMLRHLYRLM